MNIELQHPTQIDSKSNNNHLIDSRIIALMQSQHIDKNSLPLLISEQYLRNYTYLEYCMFPELFQVYLTTLDYNQLVDLLDSYMSTLMDFLIEGSNYLVSYQGILSNDYFAKRVQNVLKEQYSHSINGQTNSCGLILDSLVIQVDQLRLSLTRGNLNIQNKVLVQLTKIIKFLQSQNQLVVIISRIHKDPIVKALFDLICIFIKYLISNNCHSLLNRFPQCKYLIFAALFAISSENNKFNVDKQPIEQLVDLLQVKIMPMELELTEFFRAIKRAETKDSPLIGLLNGAVDNVAMYLKFFRLLKAIDEFIKEFKSHQITNPRLAQHVNDFVSSRQQLSEIIMTIEKCIKVTDQNETSSSMDGQWIESRNMQMMKELTVQNVEKIAKLLSRVSLATGEKEYIRQNYIDAERQQGLRKIATLNERKQHMNRQNDKRKLMDEEFLLTYRELYTLSCSIQENCPSQLNQNSQILVISSQLIQTLFQKINSNLTQIHRLTPKTLLDIKQKTQSLTYQCTLLIETVNNVNDRIQSLLNDNSLPSTIESLERMRQKLMKIKSSLMTNVLTLKVLVSAFEQESVLYDGKKDGQGEEYDAQEFIINLSDISQLFEQIIELSIESGQSNNSLNHSQTGSKISNSQQQIRTLPCLQNILLMFGSILLWNESRSISHCVTDQCSSGSKQKHHVSQFMENVVKKYSQQNVKIDSHQIIFVERILTLLQVFQDINRDTDILKVDEHLAKLTEMKCNKGLNLADVISSQESITALLELLALKVLTGCFTNNDKMKEIGQNKLEGELTETLWKIPFQKMVTFSFVSQQLKAQQVVEFFVNNIIEPQKNVFNVQSQKISQKTNTIINVDPSSTKQKSTLVIIKEYPGSSYTQLFEMFLQLKNKFLRLIKFKQQIKLNKSIEKNGKGNNQQIKEGITAIGLVFERERLDMMRFYLGMVEEMYKCWERFIDLSRQMASYSGHHPSISQLTLSQFQTLTHNITQSSSNLIESLLSLILHPKLALFKPSSQQLSRLLEAHSQSSEQTSQRLNEKVGELQKLYGQYVDFGLLGLSFLSWIRMEATVKVQILAGNNGGFKDMKKQKYEKMYCSTELLLLTMTSVSLCTGESFQINFQALQSYLTSNIQPTTKPSNISFMPSHQFPQLPLNSDWVKCHINHLGSFHFLQFIYEFIPFKINSEDEESQLYNLSVDYALNQDNHQFLNSQKTDKINLNKIVRYLQCIMDNQLRFNLKGHQKN